MIKIKHSDCLNKLYRFMIQFLPLTAALSIIVHVNVVVQGL